MAWSYSGDPKKSMLDQYRFLTGDTKETEPILQDEEINFILEMHEEHNRRMVALLEAITTRFGRAIKRSLGPQSEDPSGRLNYFQGQLEYYRQQLRGLSVPSSTEPSGPIFYKGMHDHV